MTLLLPPPPPLLLLLLLPPPPPPPPLLLAWAGCGCGSSEEQLGPNLRRGWLLSDGAQPPAG
jgi:hypothetical protein